MRKFTAEYFKRKRNKLKSKKEGKSLSNSNNGSTKKTKQKVFFLIPQIMREYHSTYKCNKSSLSDG